MGREELGGVVGGKGIVRAAVEAGRGEGHPVVSWVVETGSVWVERVVREEED